MREGGIYNARKEAKDGFYGFDFEAVYTDISEGKNFSSEFGGRKATVQFSDLGKQPEVIVMFHAESENPIEMQRNG